MLFNKTFNKLKKSEYKPSKYHSNQMISSLTNSNKYVSMWHKENDFCKDEKKKKTKSGINLASTSLAILKITFSP